MMQKFYCESESFHAYSRKYFNYIGTLLESVDGKQLENFLALIDSARDSGNQIFFFGNGGSAATASHFANDLSIGTRSYKKPYKALALTDNAAVMTAIANDDTYDDIFLYQLRNHMNQGDLVIAISASGNSNNVLKAIDWANINGGTTVGLTGFDGGELKKFANHSLHVPSNTGEYGPVEDVHMIFDHLLGSYLIERLKQSKEYGSI
ncbi:D-sedoheptulose-7-phosphate isomerase [Pseudobacteriovorax antillogorgiicola]|nr:SIS domain-containing protein [Pseudobacteriovorax antillogorgiicola]